MEEKTEVLSLLLEATQQDRRDQKNEEVVHHLGSRIAGGKRPLVASKGTVVGRSFKEEEEGWLRSPKAPSES